jgi:hypothetical protein
MADSTGAVLRAVLEVGPAPRTAVTSASRSLLAAGLLTELPGVSGTVGRPTNPLALAAESNVVLAVHVAATATSVAVVDLAGTVRRTRTTGGAGRRDRCRKIDTGETACPLLRPDRRDGSRGRSGHPRLPPA